jgi:hypothetical protein
MNVSRALHLVEKHVSEHSNNKYQKSIIDTESALREPKFTLLTAQKYIARYMAQGGEKTHQLIDLKKAVHFILFEIEANIERDTNE